MAEGLWVDAARSTVSVSRSWDRHHNAGPRPLSKSVELPESVLVKDALHALQGVPAAIKRLEMFSASFNLQAADKSAHSVSTLWASSVSTSTLAKLLSELAFAGSFRSKLEDFVKFFTGTTTKSRRKNSHGLINQAFAGAVRAILLGHTASLNQLLQSARSRRCTQAVLDEQGGPLFGYEHGALSLLELYLHTEELRLQLQALTRICLIQDDRSLESPFGNFPKGAEVLSHLYSLLVEPDPVHLELLRFLFARTCQPYVAFVRSCIYGAALKDPYGEFIVKQTLVPEKLQYIPNEHDLKKSTFKVRVGVPAPVFLVETCTQLLRTGQQLEVLLKLPQTREFAHNMATLALSAGNLEMSKPFDGFTVAFEKHGLAQVLYERNSRLEAMKELYCKFFGDVQPTSQVENEGYHSEELPPESANSDTLPSSGTAAGPKALSPSSGTEDTDSADDASVISEELVTSEVSPDNCDACQDSRDVSSNMDGNPRFCFEDSEQLHTFERRFEQPWLEFGLPQNPFISCNNETDSHDYAPTLFTETNVCWDVRSSDINEERLLKKLVPELTQVKGFLSLSSSAKTKPLSEALNNLLKQEVAVLVTRAERNDKVGTAVAGGTCQMGLQAANVTNSQVMILKQVPARGGGSWEVSLRYTEGGSFSRLDEEELNGVDDEEIPISVVVDRCIVQEILAQYRFVSASTVRVFQEKLCLQQHYLALRRYYFMEVGDWADNFVTSLGHHQNTVGRYRKFELQGILEASLQKSSCDGDSYGERLYICEDPASSAFGRSFSLEACDSIELGYRVDWPLNLVLTPDEFSHYKLIFKFLLRLRLSVFALAQISQQLQTMERAIHRERTPSSSQKGQFRVLQLFRHQIGHFVTAVQCHVQSQLLHVVWSKFLHSMQDEVKDMHDLGVVHLNYLKDALHQCFLSSELSAIKICIDNIMQCLLDFRLSLLVEGIDTNECTDRLYSKSLELKSSFQRNIQNLHKSFSVESRYLLPEFHMILDYNGFFSGSPT